MRPVHIVGLVGLVGVVDSVNSDGWNMVVRPAEPEHVAYECALTFLAVRCPDQYLPVQTTNRRSYQGLPLTGIVAEFYPQISRLEARCGHICQTPNTSHTGDVEALVLVLKILTSTILVSGLEIGFQGAPSQLCGDLHFHHHVFQVPRTFSSVSCLAKLPRVSLGEEDRRNPPLQQAVEEVEGFLPLLSLVQMEGERVAGPLQ